MQTSTLLTASLMLGVTALQAQVMSLRDHAVTTEGPSPRIEVRVVSDDRQVQGSMHRVPAASSDYGTEVSIMTEGFDKITTGSIASPDMDTQLTLDEYDIPWWNMDPAYTTLPQWGIGRGYAAGGCICLAAEGEGAHLNTPLLDCSGYEQIAVFRFRARVRKTGQAEKVLVEAAETNNMSSQWQSLGYAVCPPITKDWQTFETTFYGCGPTTMFNIYSQDMVSIYVDDIEVYQIDQYVHTPITLPHSDYRGTSFRANWQAVEGAESYLLDVYYADAAGNKAYLMEQQPVADNSYLVEGATSGETYYYDLVSVRGEHQSMRSLPTVVFDLVSPANLRTEQADAMTGTFTAAWDEVPSADVYNYWVSADIVAAEEGPFVITETDFTDVKASDGSYTGWTVESPSSSTYSQYYLPASEMGGQAAWYGTAYAPYTDYICLDAWQYYYNHEDAALHAPELDLSKDGGRLTVSLKAYGTFVEYDTEEGEHVAYHTVPAVALFNWDDTLGDYVQAELVYGETVEGQWTEQTLTLTQGSERTILGIYALGAADNLYIDDLKIEQHYQAGESLLTPFEGRQYVDGTTYAVDVPERAMHSALSHKVCAVKSAQGYGIVESPYAEATVEGVSAIRTPQLDLSAAARVSAHDGRLTIQNPALAPVCVYAADGRLLYRGEGMSITTPVLDAQMVIVRVGKQSVKVGL